MIKKILYILGIILILYVTIINKMSSTKVAFSTTLLFVGIILIALGIISNHIVKFFNKSEVGRKCFKVLKVIIALGVTCFILIESVIIGYPKNNKDDSDYIMVLGAGLSNGKYPSLTLSGRLDAAIDIFETLGKNKKIIVSGGQGSNEDISEAEAMKTYLLNSGIPEDMIITEDKSKTTSENLKFSKIKLEEDSGKAITDLNIKIVTTDFHSLRSRIIASKCGYGEVNNYSSKSLWYLVPISYLRESLAVVKSVIFD